MATTTNYGWTTPDDTALVKDGAAAIRTLGSSVDTTTKALNPSTTLGDIEYRSSTANTNTRLGIGSTGQVLTVAAGVPSWAAPATGGMSLINTGGTTLTGTSVTIGSIPQTFFNLQLIVRDFRPVSDGDQLRLKFNGDGTSNLHYYDTWYSSTGTAAWNRSSVILINDTDDGASDGLCVVDFYDYTNTTTNKVGLSQGMSNNQTTPANIQYFQTRIFYKSTNAITSLELFTDSGSGFTSGTALLYGVK